MSTPRTELLQRLATLAAASWLCVSPEVVWEVCRCPAMGRKFVEIAELLLAEVEKRHAAQIMHAAEKVLNEEKSKTRVAPEAAKSGGLF